MGLAELADDFTGVSFSLFPDQRIDEINSIVETDFFALVDKRCSQSNGNMGFTGSSGTNDTLPVVRDLKYRFVIRFIPVSVRPCRLSGGSVKAASSISGLSSLMERFA